MIGKRSSFNFSVYAASKDRTKECNVEDSGHCIIYGIEFIFFFIVVNQILFVGKVHFEDNFSFFVINVYNTKCINTDKSHATQPMKKCSHFHLMKCSVCPHCSYIFFSLHWIQITPCWNAIHSQTILDFTIVKHVVVVSFWSALSYKIEKHHGLSVSRCQ